jgi:hypothetical protein
LYDNITVIVVAVAVNPFLDVDLATQPIQHPQHDLHDCDQQQQCCACRCCKYQHDDVSAYNNLTVGRPHHLQLSTKFSHRHGIVIITHNVVHVDATNSITTTPTTTTTTWLYHPSSSSIIVTVKLVFHPMLRLKSPATNVFPWSFDGLDHPDDGSNKLNDTGVSTLASTLSCSKGG